jgi:hypothetical protein
MDQPGVNLKGCSTAKLRASKLRTDFRPKLILCRHSHFPQSILQIAVLRHLVNLVLKFRHYPSTYKRISGISLEGAGPPWRKLSRRNSTARDSITRRQERESWSRLPADSHSSILRTTAPFQSGADFRLRTLTGCGKLSFAGGDILLILRSGLT